jgi:hypothetical protein
LWRKRDRDRLVPIPIRAKSLKLRASTSGLAHLSRPLGWLTSLVKGGDSNGDRAK